MSNLRKTAEQLRQAADPIGDLNELQVDLQHVLDNNDGLWETLGNSLVAVAREKYPELSQDEVVEALDPINIKLIIKLETE